MLRPPCTGLAVAALTGLLGCAGQPPAPKPATAGAHGAPMDAQALAALYAAPHRENGVVLGGAHQGTHWVKWTKPDGSLELSAAHGLFADTGHYVLRGNQLCARWTQIDHGRENCMHLIEDGPGQYTSIGADGRPGSRFTVVPGGRDGG